MVCQNSVRFPTSSGLTFYKIDKYPMGKYLKIIRSLKISRIYNNLLQTFITVSAWKQKFIYKSLYFGIN